MSKKSKTLEEYAEQLFPQKVRCLGCYKLFVPKNKELDVQRMCNKCSHNRTSTKTPKRTYRECRSSNKAVN